MFYYITNGWKIASDLEFKQLQTFEPANEEMDLTIVAEKIADRFDASREIYSDIDKKVTYFSNSYMYMLIENGNSIRYELKEKCLEEPINFTSFVTGWGMSIVAYERDEMAIHCSALADKSGAVLITGDSGAGKSTLTSHLLDEGFGFIADDMSVVKNENGEMRACAAFPYQKLCRDVVESRGLDQSKLIYIDEAKDKFLVPFEGDYYADGAPVKALIYLVLGGEKTVWRELSGFDKFTACVKAQFITRIMGQDSFNPIAAAPCLDLASKIRVFVISRPVKGDTRQEVCEAADQIIRILNKKINTLLIDLDDTIFDFGKAEHVALKAAMEESGLDPTEELMAQYSEINRNIWKELERGEITRDVLKVERFRRLYAARGLEGDAEALANLYVDKLSKGHYWLPGAREALVALSQKYKLYVASNGTSWIQRSRINSSDLESIVDGILISEELGADKPSKAYFDAAFEQIKEPREACAMIGDSLSSDIKGGINAGLMTVWVNTNHLQENPAIRPDYTVGSLQEAAALFL